MDTERTNKQLADSRYGPLTNALIAHLEGIEDKDEPYLVRKGGEVEPTVMKVSIGPKRAAAIRAYLKSESNLGEYPEVMSLMRELDSGGAQ